MSAGATMRWRLGRRLAALGACAALAGCHTPWEPLDPSLAPLPMTAPVAVSVSPPPVSESRLQAVAREDRPKAGLQHGVQPAQFEQPALAPEGTVDLALALRLAGVDNPTINLAREAVREALAEQLAARALLLPSVNVGGNFRRHDGALLSAQGILLDSHFQSLYLGAGAGVSGTGTAVVPGVRLFAHLGDAAYEPLAARQRVTVRGSESQAVQNAVLLDVAAAYLELIGAESRLAVLQKGETELAEVVRLTEAHVQAGRGRKADADRAAANRDLLRSDLRRAEEEVAVASARLSRLLSLDPSTRLRTPAGGVSAVRLVPEDADVEALVSEALRARPEVLARAAAVAEAQTRTRQERVRPWLPVVSLGYSAGGFGSGTLGGRSEFDATAIWTVQNLGFGNRARVRAADAGVGAAVAGYDLDANQVRREVAEAVAAARAAATQIKTAESALAAAEEGFRLEMERIKQGQWRPIEVLDSFRQLLDSRQELLRAIVAFDVAQFRLFVAIGNAPAP